MVQAFGDQFLARSALADHKYGTIQRRGATGPLDRIEKGEALPDKLIGPLHSPTVGAGPHLLARYFSDFIGGFSRFS